MSKDEYLTKGEFEHFKKNDFKHLEDKVDKLLGKVSLSNTLTTVITSAVVILVAIFG